MKIRLDFLKTIFILTILSSSIALSAKAINNDPGIKTYPISGNEWTTVMGSTKACDDYCAIAGFSGGTVTATGSKKCAGTTCAYISNFATGAITTIYNNDNCGCNSQITCSCVKPKVTNICTDTDNGKDYYIKGNAKYNEYDTDGNIGLTGNVNDECIGAATEDTLKNNILREFYCDVNNKIQYEEFRCPYGCSDGICKNSPAEWDISIKFDQANMGSFYPFSSTAGLTGLSFQKKLNETDNLYKDVPYNDTCPSSWPIDPVARRAKGWYAERKKINENEYRILIRGIARADCGYSSPGYAQGVFSINPAGSWNIKEVIKCNAGSSNKGQKTFCTNDGLSVKFAAGSTCGGCCACSDSGGLDIELVLENSGIENRKIIIPETIDPVIETPAIEDPATDPENGTNVPDKIINPDENNAKIDTSSSASPTTKNIIFFVFFLLIILTGYLMISIARKTDKNNKALAETKICLKCGKVLNIGQSKCSGCGSENFNSRQ